MACSVTNGRKIPCKSSVGGIRNIFFAPYSDVTAALVPDGTGLVTLNNSEEFFKYEVKGNSSLETAITSSRENGTTFFETTLNATFTFLDIATQEQIKLLSRGRPQIVIEDYNGNAFLIGKDNGADVNGGTIVTGAAMGDLSGFTLTLVAQENEPPFFLVALPDDSSTTPINPTP